VITHVPRNSSFPWLAWRKPIR